MTGLDNNPFAALTFIAAPAILTNATSVLALGTSNRFARAVDRSRQLVTSLKGEDGKNPRVAAMLNQQLRLARRRAALLIQGLSAFYFAIGSFAAGSLSSLLGAAVAVRHDAPWLRLILIVAGITGFFGLGGLIYGGLTLVRETRLALRSLSLEADFDWTPPSPGS